jgi:hypothetical protein
MCRQAAPPPETYSAEVAFGQGVEPGMVPMDGGAYYFWVFGNQEVAAFEFPGEDDLTLIDNPKFNASVTTGFWTFNPDIGEEEFVHLPKLTIEFNAANTPNLEPYVVRVSNSFRTFSVRVTEA